MKKLKVSFDFDGTLTEEPMQKLCAKFKTLGADIFITTSRTKKLMGEFKVDNDDLYQLADKMDIPRQNITFTAYEDKFLFLDDMDMHFDNDFEEVFLINEYPTLKCLGFLFESKTHNGIVNY